MWQKKCLDYDEELNVLAREDRWQEMRLEKKSGLMLEGDDLGSIQWRGMPSLMR